MQHAEIISIEAAYLGSFAPFRPGAVTKHVSIAARSVHGLCPAPCQRPRPLGRYLRLWPDALPEMSNCYCHPGRAKGTLIT